MSLFELPIEEEPTLDDDFGLLGPRRLVAVQVIDIGRLQSEVLPLPVEGGMVAVTGRGPVDSNESSKTTFEAAVDLLGMSYAWQPKSGRTGAYAEGLILAPDGTYRQHRADQAYVLGGFRDASGSGLPPLTIIARLERSAEERLRFRVLDGLVFAEGDTHPERIADARELWAAAPTNPTYSAASYLKKFLGGHPRSAGYVNRRGNLHSPQVTLFTSELSKVTPGQIAEDLLQLSGLDELIARERQRRASVAAKSGDAERAEQHFEQEQQRVRALLEAIDQRGKALEAAGRAVTARTAWVAATTSDVVGQLQRLASERAELLDDPATRSLEQHRRDAAAAIAELEDVAGLQRAVTEAKTAYAAFEPSWTAAQKQLEGRTRDRDRVDGRANDTDLVARAEAATGRGAGVIAADLEAARARQRDVLGKLGASQELAKQAAADLELVREGGGSPLVSRLRAAGAEVELLADKVEVADTARSLWDPLLAPWRDSLVVTPTTRELALSLLRDDPGTVLVCDEDLDAALPEGIVSAPDAAAAFLRALHDGTRVDQHLVTVTTPPHHVVGGYASPQTGHQARLEAAASAAEVAQAALEEWQRRSERAAGEVDTLTGELECARAAERRRSLLDELRGAQVERAAAKRALAELTPRHEELTSAVQEATSALEQQQERLEQARRELERLELAYAVSVTDKLEDSRRASRRFDIDRRLAALRQATTTPLPEAFDALEPDPDDVAAVEAAAAQVVADAAAQLEMAETTKTSTWNDRSNRELDEALRRLGITVEYVHGRQQASAPRDVLDAVRVAHQKRLDLTASPDDDPDAEDWSVRRNEAFQELVLTLTDWLEPLVEKDVVQRDRLEHHLQEERDKVDAQRKAHDAEMAAAVSMTSAVQRLVESELTRIADAFAARVAASDGAAAVLHVRRVAPASSEQELRWEVEPAWARHPDDPPTVYTEGNPNTAQEKLKAVQLILSAFATHGPPGRVLLLDELAAGLGTHHFEEVLAALSATARTEGLTILATIQDIHLEQAIDHAEMVLFFRYRSRSELLNDPTSILAKGPDDAIADLTGQLQARVRGWAPLVADEQAWDATSPLVPDDASELFEEPGLFDDPPERP